MIGEIIRFALFLMAGFLAVITASVLVSVWRQGPAGLADLSRRGFGLRSWAGGNIPEQRDGTSIDVIEGISITAKRGKLMSAQQTRGISAEY